MPLPLLLSKWFLQSLSCGNANGDGLGAFAGQFLDLLQFFAQLARVLDLGDDLLGDLLVAVEEVEEFLPHPVDEVRADFRVPELVLGLGLENRVLQPDGYRADHAFADVVAFEFLPSVFIDGLEQAFSESAEVGAAVAGVLAVDKGIEGLAVAAVAMGETELEGFVRVMERRINGLAAIGLQVLHDQVEQSVAGLEDLAR